nr:MAG TPA: hypothetical protein [Caudoviricetes sp.]
MKLVFLCLNILLYLYPVLSSSYSFPYQILHDCHKIFLFS